MPAARLSVAAASPAPTAVQSPAADAEGSSSVALAQRRYHTRVGPTTPAPSHPRPARRAPPAKRAWTSGPGESSTSRSKAPPSPPYQGIAGAPDLSLTSIIRRPYFPATLSWGMLAAGGEISMGRCTTIYRHFPWTRGSETPCSLPFMVPRQFYYPRVVIELYHTMTSRREANPTALHFVINDRPGILRASDITPALHLLVVLANAAGYRQLPHPSTREMVRLLSMDATGGSILFRQHLPQRM